MTKTKKIKSTTNVVEFYCDNCKKFLGESEEFDDGYVPELGEYEQEIFINNDWYRIEKNLCDECKQKLTKDIIDSLKKLGFKKMD